VGVESAVFQVRYVGELDDGLDRAMGVVGAESLEGASGGTVKAVVSARDRYWIDLQAWPDRSLVSVRVALCNPPEAFPMLRTVLSVLLAVSPAVVVDVDGDARYRELADHSWTLIAEELDRRRSEFREHFGEFVAAISGDDVFSRMREL
jgi:hypothetical protein